MIDYEKLMQKHEKQPGVRTWFLDTSQCRDEEMMRHAVRSFLDAAYDKEPHIIHQVKMYD